MYFRLTLLSLSVLSLTLFSFDNDDTGITLDQTTGNYYVSDYQLLDPVDATELADLTAEYGTSECIVICATSSSLWPGPHAKDHTLIKVGDAVPDDPAKEARVDEIMAPYLN